jgi:aldehyde dehydrogenase (NAD+)
VKRVAQELGGKSPRLSLDDADLKAAVTSGVAQCMANSGQTCVAPTRMLVPRERYDEATAIAAAVANSITIGDPRDPATRMGPISNRAQYEKVQAMIRAGIEEGARVVAGGPGKPEGIAQGFYARPTVFADVRNDMKIARDEIFGPVLVMIPYDGEEHGIAIANDTEYGLAGYIASSDPERARRVAARLRVGSVRINGAMLDITVPFGGYRTSGNGREYGREGLAEFLECKSVTG